jgi:hypothetical protein
VCVCIGSCILFLCWLVSPQKVQAVRYREIATRRKQEPESQVAVQYWILLLCIFYSARWMVCALAVVFCFYVGWFRHKRFRQIATRRKQEAQARGASKRRKKEAQERGQRVRLQFKLLDSSSLYFLFCKMDGVCIGICFYVGWFRHKRFRQ